jgi:hypothetical protein
MKEAIGTTDFADDADDADKTELPSDRVFPALTIVFRPAGPVL